MDPGPSTVPRWSPGASGKDIGRQSVPTPWEVEGRRGRRDGTRSVTTEGVVQAERGSVTTLDEDGGTRRRLDRPEGGEARKSRRIRMETADTVKPTPQLHMGRNVENFPGRSCGRESEVDRRTSRPNFGSTPGVGARTAGPGRYKGATVSTKTLVSVLSQKKRTTSSLVHGEGGSAPAPKHRPSWCVGPRRVRTRPWRRRARRDPESVDEQDVGSLP